MNSSTSVSWEKKCTLMTTTTYSLMLKMCRQTWIKTLLSIPRTSRQTWKKKKKRNLKKMPPTFQTRNMSANFSDKTHTFFNTQSIICKLEKKNRGGSLLYIQHMFQTQNSSVKLETSLLSLLMPLFLKNSRSSVNYFSDFNELKPKGACSDAQPHPPNFFQT